MNPQLSLVAVDEPLYNDYGKLLFRGEATINQTYQVEVYEKAYFIQQNEANINVQVVPDKTGNSLMIKGKSSRVVEKRENVIDVIRLLKSELEPKGIAILDRKLEPRERRKPKKSRKLRKGGCTDGK